MGLAAKPKKLGLVLGSGAARGWAHIGVLRALEEMGLKPDVIAGCSVGALVGGAYLLDGLEELEAWARELSPLSALGSFAFGVKKGGFIDVNPAFKAFRHLDKNIEDLPTKFGVAAADLGTGEEVWLTKGSTLDAARASSAIPVVFHAVQQGHQWLVDGAVANPVPVSLARSLGADVVISVNLQAVPKVLERFDPPPPSLPVIVENALLPVPASFPDAVTQFIDETRRRVEEQIALVKVRQAAKPQLFETAFAAADIFQMHLARLREQTAPADIAIEPDMRDALPTAFDRADEFIEEGRQALLRKREEIEALLSV